jgi:drug/metabolite transporter (DMT)-like permease
MIYIILSVIQSTLIFVAFRLFDRHRIDNWQAITVNYAVACFLSFLLGNVAYDLPGVFSSAWLPYSVSLGFMFIATFYFFALSCQKAGVAITSVTSKMSVVIPVLFGFVLYKEEPGLLKFTGILLALAAFYLVFRKGKRPLPEMKWAFLPLMVFLGNGLVDSGMKYSQHHFISETPIPFLAFTFLTALVIALIISVIRQTRGERFQWRGVVGGAILGALNFGSTYYIFKALGTNESSVVFPLANSAIVGLSALIGFFGFKEKLTAINWTGVVIAIVAIIIIASA